MTNWQELERKYYMQVATRLPLTLVRGEGARVWDDTGKEYLDFVAGWAVDKPKRIQKLCRVLGPLTNSDGFW